MVLAAIPLRLYTTVPTMSRMVTLFSFGLLLVLMYTMKFAEYVTGRSKVVL